MSVIGASRAQKYAGNAEELPNGSSYDAAIRGNSAEHISRGDIVGFELSVETLAGNSRKPDFVESLGIKPME